MSSSSSSFPVLDTLCCCVSEDGHLSRISKLVLMKKSKKSEQEALVRENDDVDAVLGTYIVGLSTHSMETGLHIV